MKSLSGELAPGSVEVVYRWVSTIFKAAVGDRLIAASPCVRIALPKRVATEVVPLGVSDVEALVVAVPERYRALIVFAVAWDCARPSASGSPSIASTSCAGMCVLTASSSRPSAECPHSVRPRARPVFRTVPMPDVVCATLAEHLARYGPGPAGLVFTNTFGRPLRRNTVGEMWHRAAVQASLPEWATFHDLRHFYASLLKTSDVALAASFDALCDRCPIRHLGSEQAIAAD